MERNEYIQILSSCGELLERGEARRCYNLLAPLASYETHEPAWFALMAFSLQRLWSLRAAERYFRSYLDLVPNDLAIAGSHKQLLAMIQAPLPVTIFHRCSEESVRSLSEIVQHFPERVAELRSVNSSHQIAILRDPFLIRPYGVVAWRDGTILRESIVGMHFIEVATSFMLFNENDSEPLNVPTAASLSFGGADELPGGWEANNLWKLAVLDAGGFAGVFTAPTHIDSVAQALHARGIPAERLVSASDQTVNASELWFPTTSPLGEIA